MNAEPVVRVIRPQLTADEKERRMADVKKALAAFALKCRTGRGEGGQQNESNPD